MNFAFTITLSSHTIRQLAREGHLNVQNNYIQAMLQDSEQLIAEVNYLKFKNKRLMEALKVKRKKRNRGKRLNLLDKEDNSPSLFSLLRVQVACNFAHDKKVKKEQQKKQCKKEKKRATKKENTVRYRKLPTGSWYQPAHIKLPNI